MYIYIYTYIHIPICLLRFIFNLAVCVSILSCLKSLLVSYINGDFAGLQLRYEFGRTEGCATWINILIF